MSNHTKPYLFLHHLLTLAADSPTVRRIPKRGCDVYPRRVRPRRAEDDVEPRSGEPANFPAASPQTSRRTGAPALDGARCGTEAAGRAGYCCATAGWRGWADQSSRRWPVRSAGLPEEKTVVLLLLPTSKRTCASPPLHTMIVVRTSGRQENSNKATRVLGSYTRKSRGSGSGCSAPCVCFSCRSCCVGWPLVFVYGHISAGTFIRVAASLSLPTARRHRSRSSHTPTTRQAVSNDDNDTLFHNLHGRDPPPSRRIFGAFETCR